MGRKALPYTHRGLPLLLPLHPPSLLGTNLNQRDAQILSPGASLLSPEVQPGCRCRAEGWPLPGLMLIQACANTLSRQSSIPRGMHLVPRTGKSSLGGTGRRLPVSPASADSISNPCKRAAGGWAATAQPGCSRIRKNKEGKGGFPDQSGFSRKRPAENVNSLEN